MARPPPPPRMAKPPPPPREKPPKPPPPLPPPPPPRASASEMKAVATRTSAALIANKAFVMGRLPYKKSTPLINSILQETFDLVSFNFIVDRLWRPEY